MDREQELREELEAALKAVEAGRYGEAEQRIVWAWRLVEHVQKPEIPDELLPDIEMVPIEA